jgi:hypothetical protein
MQVLNQTTVPSLTHRQGTNPGTLAVVGCKKSLCLSVFPDFQGLQGVFREIVSLGGGRALARYRLSSKPRAFLLYFYPGNNGNNGKGLCRSGFLCPGLELASRVEPWNPGCLACALRSLGMLRLPAWDRSRRDRGGNRIRTPAPAPAAAIFSSAPPIAAVRAASAAGSGDPCSPHLPPPALAPQLF